MTQDGRISQIWLVPQKCSAFSCVNDTKFGRRIFPCVRRFPKVDVENKKSRKEKNRKLFHRNLTRFNNFFLVCFKAEWFLDFNFFEFCFMWVTTRFQSLLNYFRRNIKSFRPFVKRKIFHLGVNFHFRMSSLYGVWPRALANIYFAKKMPKIFFLPKSRKNAQKSSSWF